MADSREHSFMLLDEYYPKMVYALPQTKQILFRYIDKYRDKNSKILFSPYPSQLVFNTNGEDMNILFKASNIKREEMAKTVKKIELPPSLKNSGEEKFSLNEKNAIFIMLIRYFMMKNDELVIVEEEKKNPALDQVLSYYSYYVYAFFFNKYFKKYPPNAGIMEYTINNLSAKFSLKNDKSVHAWFYRMMLNSLKTYEESFKRMSDIDIDVILSALYSRGNAAMKNLSNVFYENNRNSMVVLENKEFAEGTNIQLSQPTVTAEVEKLALEYTNEFFSSRPNAKVITMAASGAKISRAELQVTLDMVYEAVNYGEMKSFFRCLFTVYYSGGKFRDIRDADVRNMQFMVDMDSIFRKGNTKDPNILNAKAILDEWLTRGSATFRKTSRSNTLTDFRRGAYLYFLFMIAGNY